jgi:hypothetical protein
MGNDEPTWGRIFDSITGIIFLGTPFRGADGFKINDMLDFAMQKHKGELNGVHQSVQGEVLRVLQPDDEYLTDLVHQFGKMREQSNSAKIACFFEMKRCNVGAVIGDKTQMVRLSVMFSKLLILP